jgi:hypothetical protein
MSQLEIPLRPLSVLCVSAVRLRLTQKFCQITGNTRTQPHKEPEKRETPPDKPVASLTLSRVNL